MTVAGAGGSGGDRDEHEPNSSHGASEEDWQDAPLETSELPFANEDVRLPWLETDDDDDEYQGNNNGQLLALLAIGLLAIAVIGGGIWWVLSHRPDDVLVADGGVIAAPKVPYKEAPKDPGGKTFAGTGDSAYDVSEGKTRTAKLDDKPAPKGPASPETKGPDAKAPGGTPPAPAGVGVQVAAYSTRAAAEAGWTRLSGQYELLSGLGHRVVEGSADIGTVYRLQVLAADSGAAHALCGKLKAAGLSCQVKN